MTTTIITIYIEPEWEDSQLLRDLALYSDEHGELGLNFECNVSAYDPGCTYGPPEKCYPPEGGFEEMERLYVEVEVNEGGTMTTMEVELPQEKAEAIYQLFRHRVESDAEQAFDDAADWY